MRTWQLELLFVANVLAASLAATGAARVEAIGALAVLASFAHGQVSDRLAEREGLRAAPDIGCWRWARRYFLAKEALWFAYFVAHRSWSALVGVLLFLAYPVWRDWYRRRWPYERSRT